MEKRGQKIPGDYQYIALKNKNLLQRQWHKNRLNLIKQLRFFDKKDDVLDAGCGSGNVVLEFATKVKSIIGIDNNSDCLVFLKKQIKTMRLRNAQCQIADLLKLDFNGKKFDKIILTEVVEHFPKDDAQRILNNLASVCKPKGKILITTPNYQSLWPVIEWFLDSFHLVPHLKGEQHLSKFTKKSLIKMVTKSGFKVSKEGTLNLFSPFIALLNRNLADKALSAEIHLPFGNLLYLEAQKIN